MLVKNHSSWCKGKTLRNNGNFYFITFRIEIIVSIYFKIYLTKAIFDAVKSRRDSAPATPLSCMTLNSRINRSVFIGLWWNFYHKLSVLRMNFLLPTKAELYCCWCCGWTFHIVQKLSRCIFHIILSVILIRRHTFFFLLFPAIKICICICIVFKENNM